MEQKIEKKVEMNENRKNELVLSLKDWIYYFLRKWWIILLVGVIGGLSGIYYASVDKTQYESRLTFSLEDNGGGLSSAFSLASEFGINLGGNNKSVFSGDNIIEILNSRRIIERVLLSPDSLGTKKQTFANEMIELNELKKAFVKNPRLKNIIFPIGLPRQKFSYLQDSILFLLYEDIIKNRLTVQKPDKKLNVYEVKFKSLQERLSKVFVEKLVEETTMFYTELRSKRSLKTLDNLQSRVESLRGSLKSSINTRSATQDANLNPAFSKAQAPILNNEADIKVYGGAYAELYKNLELARYQYLNDIPLLQVIDEPNYPMKKIKLGKFKTGIIFGFVSVIFLILVFVGVRLLTPSKEI